MHPIEGVVELNLGLPKTKLGSQWSDRIWRPEQMHASPTPKPTEHTATWHMLYYEAAKQ